MPDEMTDLLEFACPRCAAAVTERFYGPCASCREELQDLGGEARIVEAEAYEPKTHTTPNNVAGID